MSNAHCVKHRIGTPAHSGQCSHRYLYISCITDNIIRVCLCLFSEFDENASDDLDEEDGNHSTLEDSPTVCADTNLSPPETSLELMKNRKRPAESPPSKAAKSMKLGSYIITATWYDIMIYVHAVKENGDEMDTSAVQENGSEEVCHLVSWSAVML